MLLGMFSRLKIISSMCHISRHLKIEHAMGNICTLFSKCIQKRNRHLTMKKLGVFLG